MSLQKYSSYVFGSITACILFFTKAGQPTIDFLFSHNIVKQVNDTFQIVPLAQNRTTLLLMVIISTIGFLALFYLHVIKQKYFDYLFELIMLTTALMTVSAILFSLSKENSLFEIIGLLLFLHIIIWGIYRAIKATFKKDEQLRRTT